MPSTLTLVAFNEANFDLVEKYAHKYEFRALRKVVDFHKVISQSHEDYQALEPWIQWVTVYTGQNSQEHGVRRLGDSVLKKPAQICEVLEAKSAAIFALSPMNATNDVRNRRSRFIPDPWTNTPSDTSFWSRAVHRLLRQAVNDNSSGKVSLSSIITIFLLFSLKTTWKGRLFLVALATKSLRRKWYRALFLDYLLAEFFAKSAGLKNQFNFIFLNGMAHIQHHYFFNSAHYCGQMRNPDWYASQSHDPILDALHVYDRIFALILSNVDPDDPLMVMTAISQEPYDVKKFYYRLGDHAKFLAELGIEFEEVRPGMTRDFTIFFSERRARDHALAIIENCELNEVKLFSDIEATNNSIFCSLAYPHEVLAGDAIETASGSLHCAEHFVFVALKNAKHCGKGYIYSNKDLSVLGCRDQIDLKDVHDLIIELWDGIQSHSKGLCDEKNRHNH